MAIGCTALRAQGNDTVSAKHPLEPVPAPARFVEQKSEGTEACPVETLVNSACTGEITDCVKNSVVRLTTRRRDGSSFKCNGALIAVERENAADHLDKPYVLTSAYCVPDQDAAETIEVDWYHRSAGCEGDQNTLLDIATTTTTGADLLVRDEASGNALIALREAAPPGGACALLWDETVTPRAGTRYFTVFQPGGSAPQRTAAGFSLGYGVWYADNGERIHAGLPVLHWSQGRLVDSARGAPVLRPSDDGSLRIAGVHQLAHRTASERCNQGSAMTRIDRFAAGAARAYMLPNATGDDHGESPDSATALTPEAGVFGTLEDVHDVDLFAIEVSEASLVNVHVTSDFDLAMTLTDDEGAHVATDDEGGIGTSPRISRLLSEGIYYARVAAYAPNTGTNLEYFIRASVTPSTQVPKARLAFVPRAGHPLGEGFIRVTIGQTNEPSTVTVYGVDDQGNRAGPVSFEMHSSAARQITSRELESGAPEKGLSGALGDGEGDWVLELHSEETLGASAYLRTGDGVLTRIDERAGADGDGYRVETFNPGSNRRKLSLLRISNLEPEFPVLTLVEGLDDAGKLLRVVARIPPGESRTFDATELEEGSERLIGALGDGTGKWRLKVDANGEIAVVSLLRNVLGTLVNLE